MSLLVVGSVALDCVETPSAKRDDVLGGSAVFFSYAASFFSPVRMIGTVGEDWPRQHTQLLAHLDHVRVLEAIPPRQVAPALAVVQRNAAQGVAGADGVETRRSVACPLARGSGSGGRTRRCRRRSSRRGACGETCAGRGCRR